MKERGRGRITARRIGVGVVVLLLAGAGIGTWLATRSGPASAAATTQLETVSLGTITQTVSATGTIAPANQANVSFAVSGRINAVDVTTGQQVAAGQTLATVDATSLWATYAQNQATLASDQAKLASDQAANATSAQVTADQAAVTSAQAQVDSSQSALADATLTAPIAGTVAAVNVAVGQDVSAGSTRPAPRRAARPRRDRPARQDRQEAPGSARAALAPLRRGPGPLLPARVPHPARIPPRPNSRS